MSDSGGQIVPATSLVVMTSQPISFFGPRLPLHYASVTGEVELLLAGVFNSGVWGAAFMSSITQGE